MCREIIRDFDNLPRLDIKKPRVGIVGEILVKFHPAANNYLADLLESEGAEAVVPDLTDFLLYCFYNTGFKQITSVSARSPNVSDALASSSLSGCALLRSMNLRRVNILLHLHTLRILQNMQGISYPKVTRPVKDGS